MLRRQLTDTKEKSIDNFCKAAVFLANKLQITLHIPSLARQRCLSKPRGFFVISQLFDSVDYSNYVFGVSETIIQ
jgi:hypothetical protein